MFLLTLFLSTADVGVAAPDRSICAKAADTIVIRDDWGIAHVHGKRDSDAVFGVAYAQAEDDFNRIETNYLTAMGRLAEAEGETALYQDLRMRLFVRPEDLRARYAASPPWLRDLMMAWAEGLNCYLQSHPGVKPKVLDRFEPWMALSFTEGSIGGDIAHLPLQPLQDFYAQPGATRLVAYRDEGSREPGGSNGIAIAPFNSLNHHALLLINPHTSFYFRAELQMTSDAGLNAYGAVTWGQFFIYQGFNSRVGWMHTSSGVDSVDEYAETIVRQNDHLYYRYGDRLRAVTTVPVTLHYRTSDGGMSSKTFTTYRTHHGPIVRQADGRWISVSLMQKPVEALSQSFLLTRTHDYTSFAKVMELKANSSNNTIFADADGEIAYLHPQFVPRRNDRFDYTRPVDGADPATEWHGLHTLDELPHVLNPPNGWVMNTNDWPYSAAGPYSPRRADYPRYMDTAGENPRGVHTTALLTGKTDFTLASLNEAAYDPYLPAFAQLIPTLVSAYDVLPNTSAFTDRLAAAITLLRHWDYRWSVRSVETSLAVLWGDELWEAGKRDGAAKGLSVYEAIAALPSEEKLRALVAVIERLQHDFGDWRTPWGSLNRYQRLTDHIVQTFSDVDSSIPIGFTAGRWGSLAAFEARRQDQTNKYYGTAGNSFVAVVEFGDKIVARAVSTGGESGDPRSPHFNDQADRYAAGALREIYFYPSQLAGHIERQYHPR
jgi:acyl-homoserine-lactone acylase